MPASHVQVQPDSTGKDVDAQSLTSTEASNPTVYRQTITIGDPTTYANVAAVDNQGALATVDLYALERRHMEEVYLLTMEDRGGGRPVAYADVPRAAEHR